MHEIRAQCSGSCRQVELVVSNGGLGALLCSFILRALYETASKHQHSCSLVDYLKRAFAAMRFG